MHRGLSRPNFGSVVRASLVGVPLPLCSCGVILGTVIAMSIVFGLLFDGLLQTPALAGQEAHEHHQGPGWISVLSTLVLIGLMA